MTFQITSPASAATDDAHDAAARAKRQVVRWYERLWNRWDESLVRELVHPELSFRGSLGRSEHGSQGLLAYMGFVRAAFPDFHNRVDLLIAEPPHVFARLTYTGTHRGPRFELPPTGRKIEYAGAAVFTFDADLIREVWVLGDIVGLRRQLAGA